MAEAEAKAVARAELRAREQQALEITDLRRQVEEQKAQVKTLQDEELRLRKQAREIEAQKQGLEIEIARRVVRLGPRPPVRFASRLRWSTR